MVTMWIPEVQTIVLTLLWTGTVLSGIQNGSEKKLFQNITSGYNSISRPVQNGSTKVDIHFGISLNQILDLDEKHQILTTYVWIYEKWVDENIRWSPADFNGLDRVMFPAINLWVPDIYIFNIAGSALDGFVNVTGSYVTVSNDGLVQWSIPLLIKSACSVDVTFFPYDKQTCEIQFGSWIYDLAQLDIELDPKEPDLSQYVVNNEFDLLKTSLWKIIVGSSCCPGNGDHPMIKFKIEMKRKTIYYDYIVVAPTINLCVLTLATFLLPCECGWKIAIGLTVFLTLYVLQLLIAENVPDTNSTPLIGVFLLLVMTLNCVSLIMATIVMNIKKRAHQDPIPKVSPLLLNICENYLSKILCTHLSDWKRIAFVNEEIRSLELESSKLVQEETKVSHFFGRQAGSVSQRRYRNHRDDEMLRPPYSERIPRTVTAESTFSSASVNDDFVRELPYTDRLLQSDKTRTSSIKASSTNVSYVSDEDGGLYGEQDPYAVTRSWSLEDLKADAADDKGGNPWARHRKRDSYRLAIRDTHRLAPRPQPKPKPRQQFRRPPVKRPSIFSGVHMKYQWYFVADVIDKAAFLVYTIVLVSGIVTVLLIVPTFV